MLIAEYFSSGLKQRSAVMRINAYLADKDIDYAIYYNVKGLEGKLKDADSLPKELTAADLSTYYHPGFFKDEKYVFVKLKGKAEEYKDIRSGNIDYNPGDFFEEPYALALQEEYLESLSKIIKQEFQKIQDDEKLRDKR